MKRVFKLGILLGFIFSLCTAAQAAPTACKINGAVADSISGEAIPFVTIGIENNEGKVLSRIGCLREVYDHSFGGSKLPSGRLIGWLRNKIRRYITFGK
jgi:xanthosine utilization system XapX-like protein